MNANAIFPPFWLFGNHVVFAQSLLDEKELSNQSITSMGGSGHFDTALLQADVHGQVMRNFLKPPSQDYFSGGHLSGLATKRQLGFGKRQ